MFMHLPCWSLPKAHRLLTQKGVTERMEVRRGYLDVLRATASRAPGDPPGTGHQDTAFAAPFG